MAYMKDSTGRRLDTFAVEEAAPLFDQPTFAFQNLDNRVGKSGTESYTPLGFCRTSGTVYFYKSAASTGIVQCDAPDDDTMTFSTNRSLPSGVTAGNVATVVEFGAYVYLFGTDGTSFGVWRATRVAQAGDWTDWSAKLISLPIGTLGFSHISLVRSYWTTENALFLMTYGDPKTTGINDVGIWRSTDGTTWTRTYTDSTIRHIHHVAPDPYVNNHVWMTCGDGINKSIQRSTDGGVTWSVVIGSANWQGVQLSFSPDAIWIARDSLRPGPVIIDRATLTPKVAATNYHHHTPPPGSAGAGFRKITDLVTTAGSTVVASATAKFARSDVGRYVQSEGLVPPRSFIVATSQQVKINGAPTGGTFTLKIGSLTTAALAYNASAATVQTELRSAFGNASISVSLAGSTYTVTFPSAMGDVDQMTATSSLTGGSTPTVTTLTAVTLNATAINSGSGSLGTPAYVSADAYYANAFFGAIDPARGVWYQVACDSSAAGNVYGMFYMGHRGGRLEILDPGGIGYPLQRAVEVFGSYVWCHLFRYPRLS